MKKICCLVIGIALLGCTTTDKPSNSMQGAYELLSQSSNDGTQDSVMPASQLKIYAERHFIYAGIGSDSVDYFGVGEYTVEKDSVLENSIFSAADSTSDDEPAIYRLAITKTNDGYKQVFNVAGAETKYVQTEEYKQAGKGSATPLDGVWKCTRYYSLIKGDTIDHVITQYKAFANGSFLFAHIQPDSAGKKSTGIGYGAFEKVGDKVIRESIRVSTYKIAGQSFDVTIDWIDPTHYRQTVVEMGVVNVEEYSKLEARSTK